MLWSGLILKKTLGKPRKLAVTRTSEPPEKRPPHQKKNKQRKLTNKPTKTNDIKIDTLFVSKIVHTYYCNFQMNKLFVPSSRFFFSFSSYVSHLVSLFLHLFYRNLFLFIFILYFILMLWGCHFVLLFFVCLFVFFSFLVRIYFLVCILIPLIKQTS